MVRCANWREQDEGEGYEEEMTLRFMTSTTSLCVLHSYTMEFRKHVRLSTHVDEIVTALLEKTIFLFITSILHTKDRVSHDPHPTYVVTIIILVINYKVQLGCHQVVP